MEDWDAQRYEEQLSQGLALSGEDASYFAERRAEIVAEHVAGTELQVARICELGCGLGRNLIALARVFPDAALVGLDTSAAMITLARERSAHPRIKFADAGAFKQAGNFDLAFMNGVMHHVKPEQRDYVMQQLYSLLRPRGLLALFDNNPLNPGAMWVMRRIPFDRDAQPVLPWTLARSARRSGFVAVRVRTSFYFPNALRALRGAERFLARLPFGAQYVLYATR